MQRQYIYYRKTDSLNCFKIVASVSLLVVLQTTVPIWSFAQVTFTDVAQASGIDHFSAFPSIVPGTPGVPGQAMAGGVAWLDFNNDGWEDLYITGGRNSDKLYLNNQDGTFTDHSLISGIHSETETIETYGVACADVDRNGYIDIVVSTEPDHPNLLFLNNGDGTVTESAAIAGIADIGATMGISIGDYDQDGWSDIYVCGWRKVNEFGSGLQEADADRLYHNNGDGTFTDVTVDQQMYSNVGCGLAGVFSDFDMDGDRDFLLANDFGGAPWTDENQLYANDNGTFSNVTQATGFGLGINAMGIAVGDYDEDGDFDYYITDIDTNALMRNDGAFFNNVVVQAGVESSEPVIGQISDPSTRCWSWGTVFFDFDHDTYVDLLCANGNISYGGFDQTRMYRNMDATGVFEDVSIAVGIADSEINRGCAIADYDHDGDMDIALATQDTIGGAHRFKLMNHGGVNGNWLQVQLETTTSSPQALGALISVYVDGRTLLREVDSGGSSYLSHHSTIAHFGLGSYTQIDSVVVGWPSGNVETYTGVVVNERSILTESIVTAIGNMESDIRVYPNPTHGTLYVISESNMFERFRLYSMEGRLITKGNLNKNSNNEHVIVDADLRSGIYVLSLIGKETLLQKEIVFID